MTEEIQPRVTPIITARNLQAGNNFAIIYSVKPPRTKKLWLQLERIDRGGQTTHSDRRKELVRLHSPDWVSDDTHWCIEKDIIEQYGHAECARCAGVEMHILIPVRTDFIKLITHMFCNNLHGQQGQLSYPHSEVGMEGSSVVWALSNHQNALDTNPLDR